MTKKILWYFYNVYNILYLYVVLNYVFYFFMFPVQLFGFIIPKPGGGLYVHPSVVSGLDFIQYILYCLTLLMITPIGSKIALLFFPVRKMSEREKTIIIPLKELVQKNYKTKYLEEFKFNILIEDNPIATAYATGNSTVTITSSAINNFSKHQLLGLISHELGHLHYKDGLLCNIHLLISLPIRLVSKIPILNILLFIAIWVLKLFNLEALVNKHIEYRADAFACDLGFKNGMLDVLEYLKNLDFNTNYEFLGMLTQTHPPAELRINKLLND